MNELRMSAQACKRNDVVSLIELREKDPELQLVLSYDRAERFRMERERSERLAEVLVRLGVRPNLKGYQYLRTAVKLSMKDGEELEGITKRLYPDVAKKHGTSAAKVEHAIRHAVGTAWERGDSREEQLIFGYDAAQGIRPTNSEFIAGIVDYMERVEACLTYKHM